MYEPKEGHRISLRNQGPDQLQTSHRPWIPAAAARYHQHCALIVKPEPVDAVKPAGSLHLTGAEGSRCQTNVLGHPQVGGKVGIWLAHS